MIQVAGCHFRISNSKLYYYGFYDIFAYQALHKNGGPGAEACTTLIRMYIESFYNLSTQSMVSVLSPVPMQTLITSVDVQGLQYSVGVSVCVCYVHHATSSD